MIPCIVCVILLVLAGVISYYSGTYFFSVDKEVFLISVNPHQVVFETDEKFLSVALDTSFMRCLFHNMSDGDWKKLIDLSSQLSPAYLRLGGTDADRTFFSFNANYSQFSTSSDCRDDSTGNITITRQDWLKINRFAHSTGLSLIIDLNVLLRKNSEWDSTNAIEAIKFSEENGFPLDFQLGNEPNSFPHVFNTTISGRQLARDFASLKALLNSRELYRKSKLIGPDVTRPKRFESPSLEYLEAFLSEDSSVDVVSWHQYYLNGRNATLEDFINPETFEFLSPEVQSVAKVVRKHSKTLPIWISETSSAYGSGAPLLSNRFVASFLWLDKLGTAAKLGMRVVIRQSLLKGHYALINEHLSPTPDFWISLFYKKVVGQKVLQLTTAATEKRSNYLRFYSHCTLSNSTAKGNVVIYGMNLGNQTELVVISGVSVVYPIRGYVFRAKFNYLKAKTVLLNNNELVYPNTTFDDMARMGVEVELPIALTPYTIGFWLLDEKEDNICGT